MRKIYGGEKEEDWALRDVIWWRIEWESKVWSSRYVGDTLVATGRWVLDAIAEEEDPFIFLDDSAILLCFENFDQWNQ